MTTAELVSYYQKLLIVQYRTKPRALAFIQAFLTELMADSVFFQIDSAFDLDQASGKQLDVLGLYRGITRFVYGLDLTRAYWEMPEYDDASPSSFRGIPDYDDADTVNWFFLSYDGASVLTYVMNDDEFRRLIKLRAAFHSSSLGLGEIDNILITFFGHHAKITDNQDMTILYSKPVADVDKLWAIAKATDSLPRPAGVAVTVTI